MGLYPKLIGRKEPISQLIPILGCKPAVDVGKVVKNLEKISVVTVGQLAEMGGRTVVKMDGLKGCEQPRRTMMHVLKQFHAELLAREGDERAEMWRKKKEMSRRFQMTKLPPGMMEYTSKLTVTRRNKGQAAVNDNKEESDIGSKKEDYDDVGYKEGDADRKEEEENDGKEDEDSEEEDGNYSLLEDYD